MNINGLEVRVRYRHRALPALCWATESDRGHRRTSRHRPHPDPSGAGSAAAAVRTGGAAGSVSGGVRSESGLDFDKAGEGVRSALGQSLRWRGNQVR